MHNELELTLLGNPEVRLESRPVTGFRSNKAQALLYYLAVTGRPQTAGRWWVCCGATSPRRQRVPV